MTGLWKFGRHSKAIPSYTRSWSPMLDVKIILAAIAAILRGDEKVEYAHDLEADSRIGLLTVVLVPLAIIAVGTLGSEILRMLGLS
jgi:hypothetical protein